MKRIVLLFLLTLAMGATAQPAEAAAPGLWQRLTPEQRMLLWRSLTPEQKADVWRNMGQDERRAMRDRLAPGEPDSARRVMPHRGFERGDGPPHMMMSPEERQRMREQIREAHRLRRERFESERRGRQGRN